MATTFTLEKQGESITFFGNGDPNAAELTGEMRLEPGAIGPPAHVHPRQDETFRVISGRMNARVDGREVTLGEEETLTIRAGQAHTYSNASQSEPLVLRTTVAPPLHFEWFLTELARSAIRNGGSWQDVPFLEAAYILHQMRGEYRLAEIPGALQEMAFAVLARLARLLGRHRPIAPKPEAGVPR